MTTPGALILRLFFAHHPVTGTENAAREVGRDRHVRFAIHASCDFGGDAERHTAPMRRSRSRTPASWVYSSMIVLQGVVLETGIAPGLRPFSSEGTAHEVIFGNVEFFALGVTGQTDDLHAVAQRGGDALDVIRRGDENDLTHIERHIQVTVHEFVILARVEEFEQRAGRIAAHV